MLSDIKESLEFILEDPEGNAVKVCIYNYPRYLASERDVKSIFQKGSLWIIREPTYRRPGWDEPASPSVGVTRGGVVGRDVYDLMRKPSETSNSMDTSRF